MSQVHVVTLEHIKTRQQEVDSNLRLNLPAGVQVLPTVLASLILRPLGGGVSNKAQKNKSYVSVHSYDSENGWGEVA